MYVAVVAAVLLASSSISFAAVTGTISVPEAGDHYYWFSYSDIEGKQVTTTPKLFKDKKATVDLPLVKDKVPPSKLYILDAATGNEAVVEIEGKADEKHEFSLKSSGFDHVRRVRVLVSSSSTGKPAAAAEVTLKDGDDSTQTQMLDPSAKGIVEFTDVLSGSANVTVKYGEGKTKSEDIDIPGDRDAIVPTVEIPVVGDIETVEAAAPTSAETGESPGAVGDDSGRGITFPMALVGLILIAAIVYAAACTMRNRGAGFRQLMKKVGVDLPEEPQTSSSPQPVQAQAVDPTICPFCGGKKDPTTGACACSVGAAPSTSEPASSTGPRLIANGGVYAGSIYQINGDSVTIGREETNDIAFPEDSTASRRHARIARVNGEFTVYDEGSSNGTFVNGVKVTEQALKPGDEVQVGSTRLRFEA